MKYFGTDGIRGIYTKELTGLVAFRCGNAISCLKPNCKIIIGRDNRPSGDILSKCLCLGLICGGAKVIDVGVATTPAISYLTQANACDFGIAISASHNPVQYNGIKVFDNSGRKIDDNLELLIEKNMDEFWHHPGGEYHSCKDKIDDYINYLVSIAPDIDNMKFVVDCSNGACRSIAQKVFKRLNANVTYIGMSGGKNINKLCGATYPQKMLNYIQKHNFDYGFCFDGDADRIVLVGRDKIYDGDDLLFCLAKHLGARNVVGTVTSNMGLENALGNLNIQFYRANVGDKYVTEQMLKSNTCLGGEQSGHIVLGHLLPTGDGLMVSIVLAGLLKYNSIENLMRLEKYPQVQINVETSSPKRAIENLNLQEHIKKAQAILKNNGRILVRPSGTESKVRIMVEAKDYPLAEQLAKEIEKVIRLEGLCAE